MASKVLSDITNAVSKLEDRVHTVQNASLKSFRHLQGHIINLNNTMQDLSERIYYHGYKENLLMSSLSKDKTQIMLDNLNTQLLYNANRLSNLETAMLNHSLIHCSSTTAELKHEVRLHSLEDQVRQTRQEIGQIQDKVKHLDLSLNRLQSQSKDMNTKLSRFLLHVPVAQSILSHVTDLRKEVNNLMLSLPKDCHEYFMRGNHYDGSYVIYLKELSRTTKIFCIMVSDSMKHMTNGKDEVPSAKGNLEYVQLKDHSDQKVLDDELGGWTVIQRRKTGDLNFSLPWDDYSRGFGDPMGDHWAGTEVIHSLTKGRQYQLRILMEDVHSVHWEARYEIFNISSFEDNYRLYVGGFHGNATDALHYSNKMQFSTLDRDTDGSTMHCAVYNGGGWWYNQCHISNLNGPFHLGMVWYNSEEKDWIHLRSSIMMIKENKENNGQN